MNNMKKSLKISNGITLIALVITIIVLLILAGISINILSGDNSILKRAVDAKEKTNIEQYKEQIQVEVLGSFEENGDLSATKIKDNIENHITGAIVDGTDFDLNVTMNGYKYIIKDNGEVIENGIVSDMPKTKATLKNSIVEALGTVTQEELMSMNQELMATLSKDQINMMAGYLVLGNIPGAQVTKIERFNGNISQAQEEGIIVSTESSEKPIYMWFEQEEGKHEKYNVVNYDLNINSGILYWFSEADEIYFNADCEKLFFDFQNLESLNGIQGWKTDNVTNMKFMFFDCMKLTNINTMNNWNTSNVVDMMDMFCNCGSLRDVSALKNWDVKKVETMTGMFSTNLDTKINSIPIIDGTIFSKWNTASVKNIDQMFQGCSELTSLDLSNFDTRNVETYRGLFSGCKKLTTIKVSSNWDSTVFNSYDLFEDCTSLVGGAGTVYNPNIYNEVGYDCTYAHIDEGPSNPGYLTSK